MSGSELDVILNIMNRQEENLYVRLANYPSYAVLNCIARSKQEAVERFVDWLTTLTVQKEVAHSLNGGSGKAKIILCGHR